MSVKVEFHFDFGSPNTYYCHQVLPEIEERTGANFEYFPIPVSYTHLTLPTKA